MKGGGNVVIVSALRALVAAGALDRLHLVVVMNGDEKARAADVSFLAGTVPSTASG